MYLVVLLLLVVGVVLVYNTFHVYEPVMEPELTPKTNNVQNNVELNNTQSSLLKLQLFQNVLSNPVSMLETPVILAATGIVFFNIIVC